MDPKPDGISAGIINESIAEILKVCSRGYPNGYAYQFNLIKSSFEKKGELRELDIAARLSFIDLFYTTNFNHFAEFGLEELTKAIWGLCSDAQGHHSDAALVGKVEAFVSDCSADPAKARKSDVFRILFDQDAKFGITQVVQVDGNLQCVGHAAQSLISKYLFSLLENHHSAGNPLGFPIFDSIALDLQGPLYKKLGGKAAPGQDMVDYIAKMAFILGRLKSSPDANNAVWNMPASVCNTQFGLLDYFLWRVGKSGRFSFSLLWTRGEKEKHYIAANGLANYIKGKGNGSQNPLADFQSLPERFKKWHVLYTLIKGKTVI